MPWDGDTDCHDQFANWSRNDSIVTPQRLIEGNSKQVLSLRGPGGAVAIRNSRPIRRNHQ